MNPRQIEPAIKQLDAIIERLCDMIESKDLDYDKHHLLVESVARIIYQALGMEGNIQRTLTEANFKSKTPDLFSEIDVEKIAKRVNTATLTRVFDDLNRVLNPAEEAHHNIIEEIRLHVLEGRASLARMSARGTNSVFSPQQQEPSPDECILLYTRTFGSKPLEFFNSDPHHFSEGEVFANYEEMEKYLINTTIRGEPIIVSLSLSPEKAKELIQKKDNDAIAKHVTAVQNTNVRLQDGKLVIG